MGYCADSEGVDFTIPADKVDAALNAVNATDWSYRLGPYDTLLDAVHDLTCFEGSEIEDDGSFRLGWHNEKWLWNTELLIETLAPFAEHDSTIHMRGEDGSMFGFRIHHGTVKTQSATVTWTDDL